MIKTTYALEFCLAVSFYDVILGSNKARATMEEMITKITTKSRVTEE
jgi:hypothetical protein